MDLGEGWMSEELLFTPEEAFRSIKVSRAKGFQMLASGELPSIKVGRLRRIPVAALRSWVQKQVAEQTDAACRELHTAAVLSR